MAWFGRPRGTIARSSLDHRRDDQTTPSWLSDLGQDLRYAVRSMRTSPSFTTVALLTLALGIGASTAVFSLVSSVLLKPLPYPDPDRIVLLAHTARGGVFPGISALRFTAWRESTRGFQDAAAYTFPGSMNVTGDDHPEQIVGGRVSASFFSLFGARAAQGRTFTEEEDRPAGAHVAVLSHGFWLRRFGAASTVVGQTVLLDGEPHVVVGVLSADFDPRSASPVVAAAPDVWVPLQLDPTSRSDANNILVAARLRQGITLGAAQAETQLAFHAFHQAFPDVMRTTDGLTVVPLETLVVGNVHRPLALLLASVAFLLLIVCANIACLLLVRASSRQREMAIRAAAGAGRGRIVRQLLTESLVLAASGGALGLLLGFAGIRGLLAIQPGNIPRIAQDGSDVALDWRVLLFALTTSVASAVATGLVPALRASRVDLNASLKSGGDRAGSGLRHEKARALLVIAEVALASILLVGATLLVRSFASLRRVDPGFDAHRILTIRTAATERRFATTMPTLALADLGARLIGALPGVDRVGATLTELPLEGDNSNLRIAVVGRAPDDSILGSWRIVSPAYFDVFRIPLIRGRLFTDRDDRSAPPVVIINHALARRFWPTGDPLNDRIVLGQGAGPEFEDVPREIIGVVGDIRQSSLDRDPRPAAHVPLAQLPDAGMTFFHRLGGRLTWVVRTSTEPYAVADAVQHELRNATSLPVTRIRTMDDVSALSTARSQFQVWLMTIFGASALLLAALGVYGVAAYSVEQRTREIGIRVALGAASGHIRRMILVQGMSLTLLGIGTGMAAAFGLARLLAGFLFGVTPHDGVVFATVPCVLCAVALVAAWLPARRATRVDPVIALHAE